MTNCFLSAEDYQRELASGLFYEQGEGFLLLFRQRQGHLLLNFYLHPDAVLRLPALRVPVMTELACREKDREAMRRAQEALQAAQTVLDHTCRYPLTLYLVDNASRGRGFV